jgi:hypothetical protein
MIDLGNLTIEICRDDLFDPTLSNAATVSRGLSASIKELNYFAAFNVKTRKFTVTGASLMLPEDCIDVIRVALMMDGEPCLIGNNNSFWRPDSLECAPAAAVADTVDQTGLVTNFYGYWDYNNAYYERYPVKMRQFPAFYRYVQSARTIVLGSGIDVGDELMVEYHTSLTEDSAALIPDKYEPVIRNHFLRRYYTSRDAGSFNRYNILFKEAIKNIKIAERPSLADIMGVLRGEVTNAIR